MTKPKIPKNMLDPVRGWDLYGLRIARRALEIQAALYRHTEKDYVRELRFLAACLRKAEKGAPLAVAFGWPKETAEPINDAP